MALLHHQTEWQDRASVRCSVGIGFAIAPYEMLPELLPRQLGWLHVVRVLSADMRVVDMRPPRVNHKGDKSIGGTLLGRKGVTPNTRADRVGRHRR